VPGRGSCRALLRHFHEAARSGHEIDLFERNRADDTFGWGVVFSDQTVENLLANDPVSGAVIRDEFAHWDDIEVHIHGETIRSSGHGFIGIGRKRLLNILQERARQLGVRLHFEREASADLDDWQDYDLVIAADGANSRIRSAYEPHFGVDVQVRRNKFFWYGTAKVFDAFTFAFEQTQAGWVWAHAYRFDDALSTFIVEMAPETWSKLGLDRMDQPEAIALCERIFARYLDGPCSAVQRAASAGPQPGSASAASSASAGLSQLSCSATAPIPRISRSGRHEAGAGGCDQAAEC
jgi:anthraniloyl-CoA monooxygenase